MLLLILVLALPATDGQPSPTAWTREPWKAGLVGLGTQLLFLFALPVICVILMVTIIGIPLALLLAPLASFALVVLFLLGFTGVAMAGGQLLAGAFQLARRSSPLI